MLSAARCAGPGLLEIGMSPQIVPWNHPHPITTPAPALSPHPASPLAAPTLTHAHAAPGAAASKSDDGAHAAGARCGSRRNLGRSGRSLHGEIIRTPVQRLFLKTNRAARSGRPHSHRPILFTASRSTHAYLHRACTPRAPLSRSVLFLCWRRSATHPYPPATNPTQPLRNPIQTLDPAINGALPHPIIHPSTAIPPAHSHRHRRRPSLRQCVTRQAWRRCAKTSPPARSNASTSAGRLPR